MRKLRFIFTLVLIAGIYFIGKRKIKILWRILFIFVAKFHQRQEHLRQLLRCSNISCNSYKWLMLAGDSNMRYIYQHIQNSYLRENININQVCTSYSKSSGDIRWFDKDMIILFKNISCLRISLRFMHGSVNEIYRLNNTWSDIRHCEKDCIIENINMTHKDKILCKLYTRPSKCISKLPSQQSNIFQTKNIPNVLIFSHGLWGSFPAPETALACQKRFGLISKVLASFQNKIDVTWVSNPWISHHHEISRSYLHWETQCQLQHSKALKIPMINLYSFIKEKPRQRMTANDFHITLTVQKYLIDLMMKKLW